MEPCFRKQRSGERCVRLESRLGYAREALLKPRHRTAPFAAWIANARMFLDDARLTLAVFGIAAAAGMTLLGAMFLLSVYLHMPVAAKLAEVIGT
jgi:hypothetical protein